MISEFSNRSLTYDTDKFPALAGIAAEVSEIANGKYCAGTWWGDLPQGLFGYRSLSFGKPSNYLAPSWPWASANSRVGFQPMIKDGSACFENLPFVEFIKVSIETATTNLYGEIKRGAYLEMVAPLIPVNMSPPSHRVIGDGVPLEKPFEFPHLLGYEMSTRPHAGAILDFPSDVLGEVYALVLAYQSYPKNLTKLATTTTYYGSKKPLLKHLYGISVRRIENSLTDYERVGYFKTRELTTGLML